MKASVFKQIILPCSRKMYLAAWRLTGNAQASEDLVQETMLKLWVIRERIAPGKQHRGVLRHRAAKYLLRPPQAAASRHGWHSGGQSAGENG